MTVSVPSCAPVWIGSPPNRTPGERASYPDAGEAMRRFTSCGAEACLGVGDSYLRKLHLEAKGPYPEVGSGNRPPLSRSRHPGTARPPRKHRRNPGDDRPRRPARPEGGGRGFDHLQVIADMDFKGDPSSTTTAAHLVQRLALTGYRVPGIDLDPQASLTDLHGVHPEFDCKASGILYNAIRHDDPVPVPDVIHKR